MNKHFILDLRYSRLDSNSSSLVVFIAANLKLTYFVFFFESDRENVNPKRRLIARFVSRHNPIVLDDAEFRKSCNASTSSRTPALSPPARQGLLSSSPCAGPISMINSKWHNQILFNTVRISL